MKINIDRVIRDIRTLADITATPGNGVTRSSYSKEDQLAKDYIRSQMEEMGLKIWEDGFSTLFGRREGKNPDLPVIMIGSHYDSVVNGGPLDGVLGTVAALEIMRVLNENNVENIYPIEFIAMNAEEGETFGPSTGVSNSRAMVGTMTEFELDTVKNRFGQTKREAMRQYGLVPNLSEAKRKEGSIKNFIELHIEQGPVLESKGKTIGLVEFLPGIGRYEVKFHGVLEDSSAALEVREDALLAASLFTVKLNKLLKSLGKAVTGSVNELQITPNSNQFVSNYVKAKVEIRTFEGRAFENIDLKELLIKELDSIQQETGVKTELVEMRRIGYPNPTPPSVMVQENVETMKQICEASGYKYMILNNGTGHDSMIMSDFAPTNMIYVPSKGGKSHYPGEWTEYEDIHAGVDVMLQLVLLLCN